jgi:hypothetical protein
VAPELLLSIYGATRGRECVEVDTRAFISTQTIGERYRKINRNHVFEQRSNGRNIADRNADILQTADFGFEEA